MNAFSHTLRTALTLALLASSGAASAATGAYDGQYELAYRQLDLQMTCDYVNGSGGLPPQSLILTLNLTQDQQLEEGSFDALIDAQQQAIEAQGLSPRREQRALASIERYYRGLEQAVNQLIVAMPEQLSIEAEGQVLPNQPAYPFIGELVDDDHQVAVEAPGTVKSNTFSLIPLYLLEGVAEVPGLSSITGTAQLGGSFEARSGNLTWSIETLLQDTSSGAVYGCQARGTASFSLLF